MRASWLIAYSVLIEAVRRREIYAIVLISTLIIGAVMTVRFFGLEGLTKFYGEVALKVMGVASALTVIVLASRQLPREFENRTIYPLLAKPVSRMTFLAGKLLGVLLAGAFCLGLFMLVYLCGSLYLGTQVPAGLLLQHMYLQMLQFLVLSTLCFWLSQMMNLDAAISIGVIFYATSSTILNAFTELYEYADSFGKVAIRMLIYALPQLTLFDLSEKAFNAASDVTLWPPLSLTVMLHLTAYGLMFAVPYFALAFVWFRRKAL